MDFIQLSELFFKKNAKKLTLHDFFTKKTCFITINTLFLDKKQARIKFHLYGLVNFFVTTAGF